MITLGQLTKVELRDVWRTEAQDFTPWLARPENLKALAETLNMDLELEAREKEVGPFKADILCKNVDDNSWVLIENQLEKTDHTHLGQILTYAAGLQAVTLIWVSSLFTQEHRAALDWLNAITDESFQFFGLEVELWRIGDSSPAPKFNIISQPNEWARSVSQASKRLENEAVTDTKKAQLEFWILLQKALDGHAFLRSRKPRPQHWTTLSIGRSGMYLGALINSQKSRVGVELYLGDVNATSYFHQLEASKGIIEAELGFSPLWMELPTRRACRIVYYYEGVDPFDENRWQEYVAWLVRHLEVFHSVFRKRVMALRAINLQVEGGIDDDTQ